MESAQGAQGSSRSKETCPNCGKQASLPIAFGMPDEPGEETYYYVAYCTFLPPGINMGCTKCNHRWHSSSAGQPQR